MCQHWFTVPRLISFVVFIFFVLFTSWKWYFSGKSSTHRHSALHSDDIIGRAPRASKLISGVRMFPQSGGDVKFDQPWKLPEVKVISTQDELESSYPNENFLMTNLTYSKGLGNLMWQWAAISSLAETQGSQLLLPSDSLLRRAFELKAIVVTPELHDSLLTKHRATGVLFEDCCSYRNLSQHFSSKQKYRIVEGYMQNWKWFHPKHSDHIKDQFALLPPIMDLAAAEIDNAKARRLLSRSDRHAEDFDTDAGYQMKDNDDTSSPVVVGIHVRRGFDLTSHSRNLRHGHVAAPEEYYERAMDKVRNETNGNVLFIVCSDDIKWAKKHIREKEKGELQFSSSSYREVDMAVLAMSDQLIISTGTFSWWSAYLADERPTIYFKDWPTPGSDLDQMVKKDEYFLPEWTAL